jgi:hypothetical protein
LLDDISALRGENFEYLAFVIHGAPKIVRLTGDFDENLIEVPSPVRIASMMNAPLPDLRGDHRTEPVPPKPHCFVADIDTTLELS